MEKRPECENHMVRLAQEIPEGASPGQPTCPSKLTLQMSHLSQEVEKVRAGKRLKAFVVYSSLHGKQENRAIHVFPCVLGNPLPSLPRDFGKEAQSTRTFPILSLQRRLWVNCSSLSESVPDPSTYISTTAGLSSYCFKNAVIVTKQNHICINEVGR